MKNNTLTILLTGVAAGVATSGVAVAAEQSRPNVLLIVADDCNYYNIGCFGAVNNTTPNIDRLAAEGMKFDNAYNSASMSTPTRHCLYTGMYPIRNGGYPNHSSINDEIKTMPVYLSDLGYRVGLAGKWHINPESSFPFESVPGFQKLCTHTNSSYTLDGVTEFVKRSKEQPFCLVLASINPHAPWTGGDPSKYDQSKLVLPPNFADTPETRKVYASYLAEVDVLDGEVRDMTDILKREGIYDNTIIIFVSEQGGQFAGAKWTNWLPGVKSAMIAKWNGKIAPGTTSKAIVQYEDILPTLIDVAGGNPSTTEMDGRTMTDLWSGKVNKHREYAFHVHNNIPEGPAYPIRSVTDGKYRLIWNLTPEKEYVEKHIEKAGWFITWKNAEDDHSRFIYNRYKNRPEFELYDISTDPYELNNLADKKQYAKTKQTLYGVLTAWMKEQGDRGIEMDKPRQKAANKAEE